MKLGKTGKYPLGKLDETDEGELTFAVGHDRFGNVRIDFGSEVIWIALSREDAIALAKMILEHVGTKLVHLELFDLPKGTAQ